MNQEGMHHIPEDGDFRSIKDDCWNDDCTNDDHDEDEDTYDGSDHDYDDESSEDDPDINSDSKSSESTLVGELKEMWHQHALAVLVAIVASFFVHRQINHVMISSTHNSSSLLVGDHKHSFLVDFNRTATVSFCGIQSLAPPPKSNELQVFDFGLSKEHVPSLARHLAADVLQDDKYQRVFGTDHINEKEATQEIASFLDGNPEYNCLLDQNEDATLLRLRGHSYFYPSPTVNSMYASDMHQKKSLAVPRNNKSPTEMKAVYLSFTGFAVKVINLSHKPVLLYWEGHNRRLVGEVGPFESLGTATQSSGQTFVVTAVNDSETRLHQWVVTADNPILYYDPRHEKELRTAEENRRYQMLQLGKQYEHEYSLVAHRPWLAQFPRPLPVHPFWTAQAFGQTHQFSSEGRTYTMTVASVTPRVFTIDNFLSKQECDEFIQLAKKEGLKPSTLQSGSTRARQQRDKSTRSSSNTWLPRDSTELTDRVYRRSAHLLQIDESLLQHQPPHNVAHAHEHSLAESLQVVRYKKSEEYTAHHDFVYPPSFHRHQPTRFATILLYLNDNFEGGETVFPRAANAQYHDGIQITPKKGMAVLFYNMLPDGNMDDLSQHSSTPVEEGEKWLANLWVWEPHIF